MAKYKGVITDPSGSTVIGRVELEADKRRKPAAPRQSAVPAGWQTVQGRVGEKPPALSEAPVEIVEAPSGGVQLSGKYAAILDRLRSEYAAVQPVIAERAGQLSDSYGIATERYEGGKPKPKPKPRPKPKKQDPRVAELSDKYQRIMGIFRGRQAAAKQTSTSRPRRRRSSSTGMNKGPTQVPSVKVVNRR